MSTGGQQLAVRAAPAIGRPRPALFRALGHSDPPLRIAIGDVEFRHVRTFKHDSWAATALYEDLHGGLIVCKFNRRQSILGVPMQWLGCWLARREGRLLDLLAGEPNVPDPRGPITVDGRPAWNAAAHAFVPGRPLRAGDRPDAEFVERLSRLLSGLHARGIAYVDLHKRENILVGEDGQPYLIDFQISVRLPRVWPLSSMLHLLQQSDRYHLAKHVYRQRPDLCPPELAAWVERRPWWIRLHRQAAVPFRRLRRRLLVLLGIRTGSGMAHTEESPEIGACL
jgi:hypothetical protein